MINQSANQHYLLNVPKFIQIGAESDEFLCQIGHLLRSLPNKVSSALIIDRQAVVDNYNFLSSLGSTAICGAAVKADAYGMGAEAMGPVLFGAGCRDFFVAYLQEAIDLKNVLPQDPRLNIFVLNGLFPDTTSEFAAHGFVPVLTDFAQIQAWSEEARLRNKKLPAVLHIDTGMCRSGFSETEASHLLEFPKLLSSINIRYVMSHLACSDSLDHLYNGQQLKRFQEYLGKLLKLFPQTQASFANSGGIFLGKPYHFQLLRPGVALYGLNPITERPNPFKPVAHVWTRVFQVQELAKGHSVGYSQAFVADKPKRIATVALGYADGIPWSLDNRHFFTVYGQEKTFKAPIVGRISMDLVTLDVTDIPDELVQPGKWVEVMGMQNSVDDIACQAKRIGREILLNLGSRLQRLYTASPEKIPISTLTN